MLGLDVRWPFLWIRLAEVLERAAHAVAGENEALYAALIYAANDCRQLVSWRV